MWGNAPWDNDRAADWFARLMESTRLPDHVRATLRLCEQDDPGGENIPLLRAAIYCVLQFCRPYVWPIDQLDADLELAARAARRLLADEDNPLPADIEAQVREALAELERRQGS